jgi:hypothetical protein
MFFVDGGGFAEVVIVVADGGDEVGVPAFDARGDVGERRAGLGGDVGVIADDGEARVAEQQAALERFDNNVHDSRPLTHPA